MKVVEKRRQPEGRNSSLPIIATNGEKMAGRMSKRIGVYNLTSIHRIDVLR